jgi:hypothetical protein
MVDAKELYFMPVPTWVVPWSIRVSCGLGIAGGIGAWIWIYNDQDVAPAWMVLAAATAIISGVLLALHAGVSPGAITTGVAVGAFIVATATISRNKRADEPAVPDRSDSKNSTHATSLPSVKGTPTAKATPSKGQAGSTIRIQASGYQPGESVRVEFVRGPGLKVFEGPYLAADIPAGNDGKIDGEVVVEPELCCKGGKVVIAVTGRTSHLRYEIRFFELT